MNKSTSFYLLISLQFDQTKILADDVWWQNLNDSVYFSILLLILIVILGCEAIRHRYHLKRIPLRIHVNGTRGKSSVTRLIAAGLRAGGIRTCAKSTGTLAQFIYPDASEKPIYRIGHTNVIEQVKVIRKASQLNAQAIVIECMALQPVLQSLCELKLVRATHGVLTNARPDHLEIMGPTEKDVALALAGTVPVKGTYFTAEQKHLGILSKAVQDRHSTIIALGSAEFENISDEEMAYFSYTEFKENVALALAVCQSVGVDRNIALQGMWSAPPDPGVLSTYVFSYQNKTIVFANGFAANDPVSTETLWTQLLKKHADCDQTILLVNCRADRHERSAQLGEVLHTWHPPHHIVSIGTGTRTFEHHISASLKNRVTSGEHWTAEQILTWAAAQPGQKILMVGIGNIAGIGLTLIAHCRTLSQNTEH